MKVRELFYLLGIKPKPRKYPYEIASFILPRDGRVEYAQWLHPSETRKLITQEAVEALRRFLVQGDVAIDIGAHSGDTSIPMALAVAGQRQTDRQTEREMGCVLALEPNPYVFDVLKKNSELNSKKMRIIPLMIAATPEPGDYHFEYSDPGFCNGGLHEGISTWRHGHAFRLKVRGENLWRYLQDHFPDLIARVRFVKVDAEGYDFQILKSIEPLLSLQKPYLMVEIFKHLDQLQREHLYDFLVGLGYEIRVRESEVNYWGPWLDKKNLAYRLHYDIFCVPKVL